LKNNILIKQQHVLAIKEIMIVEEEIEDYISANQMRLNKNKNLKTELTSNKYEKRG